VCVCNRHRPTLNCNIVCFNCNSLTAATHNIRRPTWAYTIRPPPFQSMLEQIWQPRAQQNIGIYWLVTNSFLWQPSVSSVYSEQSNVELNCHCESSSATRIYKSYIKTNLQLTITSTTPFIIQSIDLLTTNNFLHVTHYMPIALSLPHASAHHSSWHRQHQASGRFSWLMA
jgi:hypothetical protein